jgi:hypothetical protein
MPADSILQRWKLTEQELTEIVAENPSMRGLMLGYISEYKLWKMWFVGDSRVTDLVKYDDHDRSRPGDLTFTYAGQRITVEAKSLQTKTVKREGGFYTGQFQCDASDKRTVILPGGAELATTCLVAGGFDLLAVNLFEFEQDWRFVFARSEDLPRSKHRGYSEEQQQVLLATLMRVSWPPQPPFRDEPFTLLDEIARERRSRRAAPRSSRRRGSTSGSSERGPA